MTARRVRFSWLLCLAMLGAVQLTAAEPPRYLGRSLGDALLDLQQRGLELAFSVAVVRPEMRVGREPEGSPRQVLDQLLAPHGLAAHEVAGRLVIVEVERPRPAAGPPPVAAAIAEPPPAVPLPTHLETLEVTPGRVSILEREPAARTALAREHAMRVPHLADDVYRLVARLPGVAAADISARFNVRGGDADETLVLVDGLEVYKPFHLEDFQSVFSIVDSQAVGSLDFVPGGFTAEYGDRLSASLDISTAVPAGRRQVAGLSFVNARYLDEGTFAAGSGNWLASVRRGYLDLVLDFAAAEDETFRTSPTYYDALAKVERPLGERTMAALQMLAAWDDIEFRSDDDHARGTYGNAYLWATLRTAWRPALESRTVLALGRVERDRSAGTGELGNTTPCSTCLRSFAQVDDRRVVDLAGVRQDWWLRGGERRLVKWGVDLRWLQGRYDYRRSSIVLAPLFTGTVEPVRTEARVDLEPSGVRSAAWMAYRSALGERWVAEAGLRWDRQSWVAGDQQWSPRLNLVYRPSASTTVRAAWGKYHQSQGIHELQVEDGIGRFLPAQAAEHRVLAVERALGSGVRARLDLYDKRLSSLRPRFENLFNPIELIPEGEVDRVRLAPSSGRSRGVEALLEVTRPTWEGWLGYAWSRVEEELPGGWQPRSWDQPHALTASLSYHPGERWSVGLAALHHSGWPTTPVSAEIGLLPGGTAPTIVPEVGRRNSARYPSYQRLDLRVGRRVALRNGALSWFLEVHNLLDRRNVAAVSDFDYAVDASGQVQVHPEFEHWLPRVPSFGLSWEF
jgi:hypothetical protein